MLHLCNNNTCTDFGAANKYVLIPSYTSNSTQPKCSFFSILWKNIVLNSKSSKKNGPRLQDKKIYPKKVLTLCYSVTKVCARPCTSTCSKFAIAKFTTCTNPLT